MKRKMAVYAAFVALCTAATPVLACTGMYAGKKVSADGTVLIGRTVDTPPWSSCFRAVRVPRGENVKYAYVCTPAVTSVGKGFFPSACAKPLRRLAMTALCGLPRNTAGGGCMCRRDDRH